MADATLTIETKNLAPGDLRALLAVAEGVAEGVAIKAGLGRIELHLAGLRAFVAPVAPITITDTLPVELVRQPELAEVEPVPDAEERPKRPSAANAAADGAGPKRKSGPKKQAAPGAGSLGDRVLAHLREHGPVCDDHGFATRALAEAMDVVPLVKTGGLNHALKRLDVDGLIVRDQSGKRCYSIALAGQAVPLRSMPVPPEMPRRSKKRDEGVRVEGRQQVKAVAATGPKPTMEFHEGEVIEEAADVVELSPAERRTAAREAAAAAL